MNSKNTNSLKQGSVLTSMQIQEQLFKTLESQSTHLRNNTELLNQTSADYRSNLIAINDKIIVVSIGSASLFITFLGVIFNSDKDISSLQYKHFVISIVAFISSCILLLVSRWLNSMYIFSTVHKYYLQAAKAEAKTKIKIINNSPTGINRDTFEPFSDSEINEEVDDGAEFVSEVDTQISKDEKREQVYDALSSISMWISYGLLVVAYVAALFFFSGILSIMNGIA